MTRAALALLVVLAVQVLTACAGFSPAAQRSSVYAEASFNKNSDILYLSDGGEYVYMFALPAGTPLGQIAGLFGTSGMCTDAASNVFVTENTGEDVLEYAHGGTVRIATLTDSGARPLGCAFDSSSGTVAVTNYTGYKVDQPGSVAFYKNESGNPTYLTDGDFLYYFFCTYDGNGNLYIDGQNKYLKPLIAELPKGASRFVTLHASGLPGSFHYPGGIVWDGTYLTIADYDRGFLYRLKVSGNSASVVGRMALLESNGLEQFTVARDRGRTVVIGPNNQSTTAMLWPFPKGGPPETAWYIRIFPTGAVVSYGSSTERR